MQRKFKNKAQYFANYAHKIWPKKCQIMLKKCQNFLKMPEFAKNAKICPKIWPKMPEFAWNFHKIWPNATKNYVESIFNLFKRRCIFVAFWIKIIFKNNFLFELFIFFRKKKIILNPLIFFKNCQKWPKITRKWLKRIINFPRI